MHYSILTLCFFLISFFASAEEITLCSYNCGSLSDYYDYLRGAAMQNLVQSRYNAEPEWMAKNERMQALATQIFLGTSEEEKQKVREEWERANLDSIFESLTQGPTEEKSLNRLWNEKSSAILSFYKIRPIVMDEAFRKMLVAHIKDLTGKSEGNIHALLPEVYAIMAKRIFENSLDYDILCLQEADFLNASFFPTRYESVFSEHARSKNAIIWNKDLFERISSAQSIMDRSLIVKLKHKASGKELLIVSGHFTGCNPYKVEINPSTGESDSKAGDKELTELLKSIEATSADLKIVAADTNVTAFHPRLRLLYDAGYRIDNHNFLEPTCCSPHLILNTRIDWIFCKESNKPNPTITNIPVLNVSLNSMQTNISDHKPVAAKIHF